MRPVIGITANYTDDGRPFRELGIGAPGQRWDLLPEDYARAVERAGGLPVILPLTALSAGSYLFSGSVDFSEALPYLLGGLPGCWVGSRLLGKLSSTALSRIFGVLILFAAGRMWLS